MGSDEKPTVSKNTFQKPSNRKRYRSPSPISLQDPGPLQAAMMKVKFESRRGHSPLTRDQRSSTQYRHAPAEVSEKDRRKVMDHSP